MARYTVTQTLLGSFPVVRHTGIRREAGATTVRDAIVADTRAHLTSHAGPGGRVIEGPTGVEGEVALVLLSGDGSTYTVVTSILRG